LYRYAVALFQQQFLIIHNKGGESKI